MLADDAIERELAKVDGTVLTSLAPSEVGHLHFRLDRAARHRLIVQVASSEDVEVVLWHDLAAMQAERRSPDARGKEWAYAKGRRFSLHTTSDAPGGYWLVAIENLSGFKTDLSVRAWAEHPAEAS